MDKEFFINKKIFYRQVILGFVFLLFAGTIIFTGAFDGEVGVFFIVGMGFLYSIYQLYQQYQLFRSNFPILKITEEGLYFQTKAHNQRFTPWEEIEQAGLIMTDAYDTLMITGSRLDEKSSKLNNFLKKLDPMVEKQVIVSINGQFLQASSLEVLDALPCKKSLLFDTGRKKRVMPHRPLDEFTLIKKYQRIQRKTRKGKFYSHLTKEEVNLYFVNRLDQTIKESGIAYILRSIEQYTLWVSIQALQALGSTLHLALAENLEELRHKQLTEEELTKACLLLEEKWQNSTENLLTISLDYYNQAFNLE